MDLYDTVDFSFLNKSTQFNVLEIHSCLLRAEKKIITILTEEEIEKKKYTVKETNGQGHGVEMKEVDISLLTKLVL